MERKYEVLVVLIIFFMFFLVNELWYYRNNCDNELNRCCSSVTFFSWCSIQMWLRFIILLCAGFYLMHVI